MKRVYTELVREGRVLAVPGVLEAGRTVRRFSE
jgi:hypothetical protein